MLQVAELELFNIPKLVMMEISMILMIAQMTALLKNYAEIRWLLPPMNAMMELIVKVEDVQIVIMPNVVTGLFELKDKQSSLKHVMMEIK